MTMQEEYEEAIKRFLLLVLLGNITGEKVKGEEAIPDLAKRCVAIAIRHGAD